MRVVSCQGGLSSGWSHEGGVLSGRMVSHHGGLMRVVSCQGGLSLGRSPIRVVS